jgi:hypothetical protein
MNTRNINVTDLRVGDTLMDGKNPVQVSSLVPCTSSQGMHVNRSMCYDNVSSVTIKDR